jgi:hypothetical protein
MITLRSHKVWLQPNDRLSSTVISGESHKLALKVTLEIEVDN